MRAPLYLLLMVLSLALRAEGAAKTPRLLPVPVSLSGTYRPLAIAVDGNLVVSGPKGIDEITLNGVALAAKQGKRRPFFHQTDVDRLELGVKGEGAPENLPIVVELPRLEITEASEAEIVFRLAGEVRVVTIGGSKVEVVEGIVRWPLPSPAEPRYVVELKGLEGKPGRFYQLMVPRKAREVAADPAPAVSEASSPPVASKLALSRLYFAPILVYQSAPASSYSMEAAWFPRYALTESFDVALNIGFSVLNKAGGGKFVMMEYELLAGFAPITGISVEIGGGAQTWMSHGGTKVVLSAHAGYQLSTELLEKVFLGYSLVLDSRKAHQLKLGGVFRL